MYRKAFVSILEKRKHFAKGCIYALIGAFLWGFSGICSEVLVDDFSMTPAFITVSRAIIAAAIMIVIACVRRKDRVRAMLKDKKTVILVLISGLAIYMSQYAYAQSVAFTNAGTATVLQSPACVLVMIVVCVEFKRFPGAYQVLGIVMALGGTWLIATGGDSSTLALPIEGLGWGAINSLAIAAYILIPRTLFEKWGTSCPIALSMGADALVGLIVWFVTEITGPSSMQAQIFTPWSIIILLIGSGILGTLIAFSFYLHGCALVGSVTGSLIGAIEPVSAMLLAVTLLGHTMSWADWVGMILMVIMICFIAIPVEGNKKVNKILDIPKRRHIKRRKSA